MSKRIFHVSEAHLEPSSILKPGSWGERTRAFKTNQMISHENKSVLLWETLLELARVQIRPDAVSRLDCVFACENLEAALYFRNKNKVGASIYEAEMQEYTPAFRGNIRTLDFDGRVMSVIDWNIERCQKYWSEEGIGEQIEMLCGGPIAILRRVEDDIDTSPGSQAGGGGARVEVAFGFISRCSIGAQKLAR